jgi:hypothetical protein
MSSLEGWENKFGGNDEYVKSSRRGFDFELGVAYRSRVTGAKIVETKRGDICLQLDLALYSGHDVVGTSMEWFTLPKQASDESPRLTPELVRKLTYRRRDDLQRILSTVHTDYSKYATRILRDGSPIYFDEDGLEMSHAEVKAREKDVYARTMEWSDAHHDRVGEALEDLKDAVFYLVKAPNPKNGNYPYTNVYNSKPDTIPVLGAEAETLT